MAVRLFVGSGAEEVAASTIEEGYYLFSCPERNLELEMQRRWSLSIKKAQEKFKISIFTKSSCIIDCFNLDQILVVCGDKSRLLSEHSSIAKLVLYFTSGEIWNIVGEEWVT